MNKWKCTNLECENFDKVIESLEENPQCPKCGSRLYPKGDGGGGSGFPKRLIIILVILLLLIGAGILVIKLVSGPEEPVVDPVEPPVDTLMQSGEESEEQPVEDPVEQPVDPLFGEKPSGVESIPIPLGKDTVWMVRSDTVRIKEINNFIYVSNSGGNDKILMFDYGYYIGSVKNGVPDGYGVMVFLRKHEIPSKNKIRKVVADFGYEVRGVWENGYIKPSTGEIYDLKQQGENGDYLYVNPI